MLNYDPLESVLLLFLLARLLSLLPGELGEGKDAKDKQSNSLTVLCYGAPKIS